MCLFNYASERCFSRLFGDINDKVNQGMRVDNFTMKLLILHGPVNYAFLCIFWVTLNCDFQALVVSQKVSFYNFEPLQL